VHRETCHGQLEVVVPYPGAFWRIVFVVHGKAKGERPKGEQALSEPGGGAGGLQGRAALVTGASSGLGRAVTIALAEAGADVALVARSEKDLRETEQRVSRAGRRALALATDLASTAETRVAVERTAEAFGGVDVLVNAAGTDVPGPVEELSVEGWDRTPSVNLKAPFLLSKAVFPRMREAGGGTIVNFSSVAGKKGWANASAYCASKFGLTGLTEVLADEGRPHGSGQSSYTPVPWRPTGAPSLPKNAARATPGRRRSRWPFRPPESRISSLVRVIPAGLRADRGDNRAHRRGPAVARVSAGVPFGHATATVRSVPG
jgi:NAD(P)-dependent dehydrogenase (short-subunit alcohol dehydrogenase family)